MQELMLCRNTFPYVGEDLARSRAYVTTLGDLLLDAWDRYPDRPALIFPDSQRTYSQLVANAMRIARGLRAMGVEPRANVAVKQPAARAMPAAIALNPTMAFLPFHPRT